MAGSEATSLCSAAKERLRIDKKIRIRLATFKRAPV
jgi:hypothetical protein